MEKLKRNNIKYLIYLDILGFDKLADFIANEKKVDSRDVREKFIRVINEKIGILEEKDKIIGKKYGDSDDWILITDSLDNIFTCIFEILDHYTGYGNYELVV